MTTTKTTITTETPGTVQGEVTKVKNICGLLFWNVEIDGGASGEHTVGTVEKLRGPRLGETLRISHTGRRVNGRLVTSNWELV